MAQQRKRTDLIERTRYPNPLPLPPYAPKLLSIPTPADRYADPTWSSRVADSVPFPLVVDAEGGMPLDLNSFPELWAVDASGRPIQNPHPRPLEASTLHPEDAWLTSFDLASTPAPLLVPLHVELAKKSGVEVDGPAQINLSRTVTPQAEELSARDVAWLRRTEYIGADRKAKAEAAIKAARPIPVFSQDASPSAEAARILETFQFIHNQPMEDPRLRHPTKKDLRPVECFELFPDFDTWATELHIFKFSDVPGKHDDGTSTSQRPLGSEAKDSRIPLSLLRPRRDPTTGRGMVSFFLPISTPVSDVSLREFDRILLRDLDAFDEEDRVLFADQAGDLDESVREAAIIRREEKRRQRGWTGPLPPEPKLLEGEEGISEEALAELARARAEACTPYGHQRDYDAERQGLEEEMARLLVLNFADEVQLNGQDANALIKELPLLQKEKPYLIDGEAQGMNQDRNIKAAYYHPVKSRVALRVKRSRRHGDYLFSDAEYWPTIGLTHRDVTNRELVSRLRKRKEIEDIKLDNLPELSESDSEDGEAEVDSREDADRNAVTSPSVGAAAAASDEEMQATQDALRARGRAAARAALSDDDDNNDVDNGEPDAGAPRERENGLHKGSVSEEGGEDGEDNEDEDENEDKDTDDDDDNDDDDDSMDADKELAALWEEAKGEGTTMSGASDDEAETDRRGARSRRLRRTIAAAPFRADESGS